MSQFGAPSMNFFDRLISKSVPKSKSKPAPKTCK